MNKITRIKKLKEAMLIDKQDKLVKYEKQLNEKADYVFKLIDTLENIYPPNGKQGTESWREFHRKWCTLYDCVTGERDVRFATHFYIQDKKAVFVMANTKEAVDEMHRIQKEDRKRNVDPALAYSLMASMQKHLGSK